MSTWIKGVLWGVAFLSMGCEADLQPLPDAGEAGLDMAVQDCTCRPTSGPGCPRFDDPEAPACLRAKAIEREMDHLQSADCFQVCGEEDKAARHQCFAAYNKDAYTCWAEESEFVGQCTQAHSFSECQAMSARIFDCGDTARFDGCVALAED